MEDKKKENNRVLLFFLFPILLILGLLITVIPQYFMDAGLIGIALATISVVFYYIPSFKEELLGIKFSNLLISIGAGLGVFLMFFIVHLLAPAFAIGFPELSLSIRSDLRWFLVVMVFPILEEVFFRSVIMAIMIEGYKVKLWVANLVQGIAFMFYHLLAYGVILGAYARWVEAFGAFNAVLGLFISALVMGLIWGYVSRVKGIENIVMNITSHILINATLFTAVIVYI